MQSDLAEEHDALLFGVRKSIRYHRRRAGHFERFGMFSNTVNVICGTGAIGALLGKAGGSLPLILTGAVAVLSTIDLVVSSSKVARLHSDLAMKFAELERRIVSAGDPTIENLRTFEAERLAIEAEEPEIKRTLDILCHNEVAKALGRDAHIYRVNWFKRRLAHYVSFDTSSLQLLSPPAVPSIAQAERAPEKLPAPKSSDGLPSSEA